MFHTVFKCIQISTIDDGLRDGMTWGFLLLSHKIANIPIGVVIPCVSAFIDFITFGGDWWEIPNS